MKKKTFVIGNIQCVLILGLYVILFFVKNDLALIISFCYSLFLGFLVLKSKNTYFLFNDSLGIFLIFLFLYGFFNPIIEFSLLGEISKGKYMATIIYASTIPAYIIGSSLFFSSAYDSKYAARISSKKDNKNYAIFIIWFLLFCLFYISYDLYSQGILFRPSVALKTSRLELFTEISQLKIVVGLFVTSIFLYFIYYYNTFSHRIRWVFIFLLIYFVAMELSVGNRRDFVPMIVGAFWVFVNSKKIKFTFGRFLLMLVGLFLFLFLGSIRSSASSEESFNFSELAILTLSSNEFVYPFYTLNYSVDRYINDSLSLFYGSTIIFYPFLYFIPRVIFPLKPVSLAVQFVSDIGSTMGYAYSPVTEFFVNFGVLGPFFGFLVLGMIISKMQGYKDQRFIFLFFTMIPDFCRGEIGTFIYQFFFVSFFVITLPVILNYKPLARQNKLT